MMQQAREPPQPTRRQFLKGLTTGTVAIGALSQSGCARRFRRSKPAAQPLRRRSAPSAASAAARSSPRAAATSSTSRAIPGHPISEGTLCSKGASAIQVVNNPRRLQKVLYRAPRGAAWEEKTWDWALERIAARVKETRDKTFKTTVDGRVVNRTEAIACLGGSALDNEEAYLLVKLMRALGLVYVEHQARL